MVLGLVSSEGSEPSLHSHLSKSLTFDPRNTIVVSLHSSALSTLPLANKPTVQLGENQEVSEGCSGFVPSHRIPGQSRKAWPQRPKNAWEASPAVRHLRGLRRKYLRISCWLPQWTDRAKQLVRRCLRVREKQRDLGRGRWRPETGPAGSDPIPSWPQGASASDSFPLLLSHTHWWPSLLPDWLWVTSLRGKSSLCSLGCVLLPGLQSRPHLCPCRKFWRLLTVVSHLLQRSAVPHKNLFL